VKHAKKRYSKPGSAPGVIDAADLTPVTEPNVTVIDYGPDGIRRKTGLAALSEPWPGVRWVHVRGTPSLDVLERLRREFKLDPLALEDVVHTGQRPKMNVFEDQFFVTLVLPNETPMVHFEQLSVFASERFVVTFHDGDDHLLEPIRQRLESGTSTARRYDGVYLLYALVDLAVDHLFPAVDVMGSRLAEVEGVVMTSRERGVLAEMHEIRNVLLVLRRTAWALREVTSDLLRLVDSDSERRAYLRRYLQDCYEHAVSVIDLLESQREVVTSLVEVYLSLVSNRLNDVMRVLAVIATLFIPPTFVVGVYGMNFDRKAGPLSMPELGWPFGYVGVMILIVVMMVAMLWYFRRREWL